MNLQAIPRALIGSSLKLARFPFDRALSLGGNSTGPARLMVDRVDATLRGAAGWLLRDDTLQADASRRQAAAKEREHANRLRAEAAFHSDKGEEQVQETTDETEALRRRVEQAAEQKRKLAKNRRDARKSTIAKKARSRQQAAQNTAQNRKRHAEDQGKRERLKALDSKSSALGQKEAALVASEEATRLQRAASKAKANRKDGS